MQKPVLALIGAAFLTSIVAGNALAREVTSLNSNWRFRQDDQFEAEQIDAADRNWKRVALPHNWGWEQAQKGQRYLRGPGWYRRPIELPYAATGKRYFVRFEAAGTVADVYFNGRHLGQHRGGFAAFACEITPHLSPTGTNILALRVSNAPDQDVAPLSGDFPVYGGLYRPAHLLETDAICITPLNHGSPGVAWLQTSVTAEQALLDVNVEISNGTRDKQDLVLAAVVLDAAGNRVAGAEQSVTVVPRVTAPFSARVEVPRPHLWNGVKDPYLYRAVVELRSADGAVRDAVEQPLGLRYFRVDPERGFFLNGQPYHLHGVNRHQDRPDKGWALTEGDQDEDLALIREIGCTVVRCAHYQHSDYFYGLCDKAGLLVWAELPQVDRIDGTAAFAETSRNQWLDLIRQNINHPSIFAWSLFNELRPNNPDPHRLLQDLVIVARGEDPTRPTIAATCTGDLPQMNRIPDLLGWNIYPGWYSDWGPKEDFGPKLQKYNATSRQGGYCISEYGAGANIEHHEQNPTRPPKTTGQWHPEEWQAILHETAWGEMKKQPQIWGTFVWNMFDFTSYWRNEGAIPGRNDKGLVTYDRQTRKDAFYFYKANWSDEPVLYIASRRFTERTNAVTDVKVYSNAGRVELFVNGKSQGAHADATNGVFFWKDITLQPGRNQVETRARRGSQSLQDACAWTLAAPAR